MVDGHPPFFVVIFGPLRDQKVVVTASEVCATASGSDRPHPSVGKAKTLPHKLNLNFLFKFIFSFFFQFF